jgi:chromate transport protein ChrA
MQRDQVERRKWVTGEDYFEGLAFSRLAAHSGRASTGVNVYFW